MRSFSGICTLLLGVFISQSYADYTDESTPMVAVLCGKPTMYLRNGGWVRDETKTCLEKPQDILDYCKEVYPELDVRNVVESSTRVSINNWCNKGVKHCSRHGTHTVLPYRCLVGAFQSDALLVPEHCLFDHKHEPRECANKATWTDKASKECDSRGMTTQSSAILLPCGIDMFSGVEFVCCPKKHDEVPVDSDTKDVIAHKPVDDEDEEEEPAVDSEEQEEEDDDDYYDDDEDDYIYDDEDEDYFDDEDEETKTTTPLPGMQDTYAEYLKHPRDDKTDEHSYFSKAKADLQKHHHEKVTKMMKEWAAARQRVQEMKSSDAKGAERLNMEITSRFQKTYQALEQEGMAEKKQLVGLHQQRVQSDLNDKKRNAMEHYMAALQRPTPEARTISKALKHYIKTEEKDRMHSINHYKHMRDTDPEAADRARQLVKEHMTIIEQRIHQAIDMLSRVPDMKNKIQVDVENYMMQFEELNVRVQTLLAETKEPEQVEEEEEEEEEEGEEMEEIDPPTEQEQPQQEKEELVESETGKPIELEHVPLQKEEVSATRFDDETMENEAVFIDIHRPPQAQHQAVNNLQVDSYITSEHIDGGMGASGSVVGIAIGSLSMFVLIVVGIVILKKRSQRVPQSHGFVEVDPAASPEERHVANMQMNGYENPTYKYFEMGPTSA